MSTKNKNARIKEYSCSDFKYIHTSNRDYSAGELFVRLSVNNKSSCWQDTGLKITKRGIVSINLSLLEARTVWRILDKHYGNKEANNDR